MASKQLSRYASICFCGVKLKDCFSQPDLNYIHLGPLPDIYLPRAIYGLTQAREKRPGFKSARESIGTQVILDPLFSCAQSLYGAEKGEFRNWTIFSSDADAA